MIQVPARATVQTTASSGGNQAALWLFGGPGGSTKILYVRHCQLNVKPHWQWSRLGVSGGLRRSQGRPLTWPGLAFAQASTVPFPCRSLVTGILHAYLAVRYRLVYCGYVVHSTAINSCSRKAPCGACKAPCGACGPRSRWINSSQLIFHAAPGRAEPHSDPFCCASYYRWLVQRSCPSDSAWRVRLSWANAAATLIPTLLLCHRPPMPLTASQGQASPTIAQPAISGMPRYPSILPHVLGVIYSACALQAPEHQ
jgi:hypothetical protein